MYLNLDGRFGQGLLNPGSTGNWEVLRVHTPRDGNDTQGDGSLGTFAFDGKTIAHTNARDQFKVTTTKPRPDAKGCRAGLDWYKVPGGWRCAEGRHFIADEGK